MYCPECGKVNSADQKFCRACGLSLEKVVKALADATPVADMDQQLVEKTRKVDRLMIAVAGTGFVTLLGLLVWGIIYKVIYVKGHLGQGIALLTLILGGIAFGVLAIYRDWLQRAALQHRQQTSELRPSVDTSKLLHESRLEPVPSVTDRTTELLHVERESAANQTAGRLEKEV